MTISILAHTIENVSATLNTTTPAIDTTGASLIVAPFAQFIADAVTLSDSKSNSWTAPALGGTHPAMRFDYVAAPTVGAGHTFSTSGAGTYGTAVAAIALSGTAAAPVDQTASNYDSSGTITSIQAGSVTPSEGKEICIAVLAFLQPVTGITIDQGYTILDSKAWNPGGGPPAHYGMVVAYKVQTNAVATNPTWSFTNGGANIVAGIATYKDVSPVDPVDHVDVTGPASVPHFGGASYTGTPKDSGGSPVSATVTYRSTNTAVLIIDASTGAATALTSGSASVIATAGGVDSAPYAVTVTAVKCILWHGIASDDGYIATPEMPRVCYDTSWHPHTGTVWNCSGNTIAGSVVSTIANAVTNAVGGDAIVLPDSFAAVLPPFPARSDTSYLHVRSYAIHMGTFPCPASNYNSFTSPVNPASRVRPANLAACAQVGGTDPGTAVISFQAGAGYVRFEGIHVEIDSATASANGLVIIGDSSNPSYAAMPHHLIFDRCAIRGGANLNIDYRAGVNCAGRFIALVDCWVDRIHSQNQEAQAFFGFNAPGPFKIVNCFISGACMSYLTGGGDPWSEWLIPSDCEFRKNHSWKDPLWWDPSAPSLFIKNHLEHKNGRRDLIEDCLFENHAVHSGWNGPAIIFQPISDNTGTPWMSCTDITIRRVQILNCPVGLQLAQPAFASNRAPVFMNQVLSRLQVRDVFFQNLGENSTRTSGEDVGYVMQLSEGMQDIDFQHVTATNGGHMHHTYQFEPSPRPGLGVQTNNNILKNNVLAKGSLGGYAVVGEGSFEGVAINSVLGAGATWNKQTIYGFNGDTITDANFPAGTTQGQSIANEAAMQFNPDYSLKNISPAYNFSDDGIPPGCDMAALAAGLAGVPN